MIGSFRDDDDVYYVYFRICCLLLWERLRDWYLSKGYVIGTFRSLEVSVK